MSKTLLIILFMPIVALAVVISDEAKTKTEEAILKTQPLAQYKSNAEKQMYAEVKSLTGIEKETAATTAAIGYSVYQKKLDSKPIKWSYKPVKDVVIKPEATYYFTGEARGALTLTYSF